MGSTSLSLCDNGHKVSMLDSGRAGALVPSCNKPSSLQSDEGRDTRVSVVVALPHMTMSLNCSNGNRDRFHHGS